MPIQANTMGVSIGKTIFLSLGLLMLSYSGLSTPPVPDLDGSLMGNQFSEESNLSANFTSSGGSGLAISGEPAYVGDSLIASIMVTNSGNSTGSVSLHISLFDGGENFQGDAIEISPGSTREVPTSFKLLYSGSNSFHWWLAVEGHSDYFPLEGNISVEVMPSQTLNLSIDSIDWTTNEGLKVQSSIFLSQGSPRVILLEASSGIEGSFQLLQRIVLESDPGRRTFEFYLGHPSANEILIEAIPIGWQTSSESLNLSKKIVQEPIIDESSIILEASFTPDNPTPGSKVMASISLTNTGNNQVNSGNVRVLMSSDLEILAETELQAVMPGSKVTTEISLPDWPASDRVDIEVQWFADGVRISSYYSVQTNLAEEGLELPFDLVAAGYGILTGSLVILIGTLVWRAVSSRTPSTSDFSLRETKESVEAISKQEKKETECPFCEQRLMIPDAHSGGVRCPSCSMEFIVGEPETKSYPVVSSSEDTLNCPECEQALRVKMENRPVMSRCPVCKTNFMAESEGV